VGHRHNQLSRRSARSICVVALDVRFFALVAAMSTSSTAYSQCGRTCLQGRSVLQTRQLNARPSLASLTRVSLRLKSCFWGFGTARF